MKSKAPFAITCAVLLGLTLACNIGASQPTETTTPPDTTGPAPAITPALSPLAPAGFDKWTLWTSGARLRGANIWQRIVVPDLDGPEFLGSGYVGPPYTQ